MLKMEKEKRKNKSQARTLHTNWNTTNHGLTPWNMISTRCRRGNEGVRHRHSAQPRDAPTAGWALTPALAGTSPGGMETNQPFTSRIPGWFWSMQKYCPGTGSIQYLPSGHALLMPEDTPILCPRKAAKHACLINASLLDD